ncbi:prepilin-type N-terminal cleavage/methylation domain-containing protein [Fluctibacter corallii]|uniref:prepilin-type N-terminal cleavage/methylation domain-containing protein n=1 Tax=Fluctibacter corallii TaxID=2984329 RepID=UPI0029815FDE|nr:prepilin-type N-terminal cleavage/methylation domain-containing protein [Aestuariibacter sp. AA17]
MQQRGFTLIELIIVIVILGVLAVTAAPRFLDLGGNARSAAMQGIFGAVQSSTQIARAALLIQPNQTVSIEGVTVQFFDNDPSTSTGDAPAINGYPHAEEMCALIGLAAQDGNTAAANQVGTIGTQVAGDNISCNMNGTTNAITIRDDRAPEPDDCSVVYTESTAANVAPVVTLDVTGCQA